MDNALVADLKAVRELLDVSERWTQGEYARSFSGRCVHAKSELAVCFCISGAIIRLNRTESTLTIRQAIESLTDGICISTWNDQPGRTHAEVLALIDSAIAKAEGRS